MGGLRHCRSSEGFRESASRIETLPDDLLLDIFQKLEPHESHRKLNFRNVSRVSKRWYSLANDSRTSLSLTGFKASKMKAILGRFRNLESLNLGFLFDCSDEALALVGSLCRNLRDLQLSDTYRHLDGGAGLVALVQSCSRLESLSMHGYRGPESSLMAIGTCCRQLKRVRLRSASCMGDAAVVYLAQRCRNIEDLDLSFNDITDVSLCAIGSSLPRLRQLDLKHCKRISGKGIASLAAGCLQLRVLHLGVVDFGDVSLIALGTYSKHLEELYLDYGWGQWGRLSSHSLQSIARGCPHLRLLSLRGSKQVDDGVLQGLSQGCPSLTSLDLHACDAVGDGGLQAVVRGCKQLQNLVLSGTNVGGSAVPSTAFSGGLPHLNTLRLNGDLVTDDLLVNISRSCPQLRDLQLANCGNVSDSGVRQLLRGCSHLKLLSAKASPQLTGVGFGGAAASLESISLPFCGVTDEGLRRISETCGNLSHLAIPQCRHVSAATLVETVKRCSQLRELIIVGCLQISRDEVLDIVRASRYHMKTMRVSRPDSPQDEYTILKRHGTWILPSWARTPSPPRDESHGELICS